MPRPFAASATAQSKVLKALGNKKAGMHRVFHLHGFYLLMVIDKVNVKSVSIFKAKNNPPVCADSNREKTF